MKFPILFLSCWLPLSVLAIAPHPSMLTAEYKSQRYPVVSVHGKEARMLVDGKEKETWDDPRYEVKGANGFADNFVAAAPGFLTGLFERETIGDPKEYGPRSWRTDFEAPLTATKAIKHGFAVLVLFSDQPNQYPGLGIFIPTPEIIVHDLPKLPAGKTVKVKFSVAGYVFARRGAKYFTLIFDDSAREVRTSESEYAWQYFAWCERVRHFNAMGIYLARFKGADQDASPFVMPQPLVPLDAVKPASEFAVTLSVAADGSVSAVDAAQITDAGIRQRVVDAMGGWLFLPKLQAGTPVATRVTVPLKF